MEVELTFQAHGGDMSHRSEERILTGGELNGDAVVSLSLQDCVSCENSIGLGQASKLDLPCHDRTLATIPSTLVVPKPKTRMTWSLCAASDAPCSLSAMLELSRPPPESTADETFWIANATARP